MTCVMSLVSLAVPTKHEQFPESKQDQNFYYDCVQVMNLVWKAVRSFLSSVDTRRVMDEEQCSL